MFQDRTSFVDRPFGVPADAVLDIPVPLSVNETRKVNPAALGKIEDWKERADKILMASGQFKAACRLNIQGPYDIAIILDRTLCKLDPDNPIKNAIDYLRRLELIPDDSPRHIEQIVIRWGEAPRGCRILLRRYVA